MVAHSKTNRKAGLSALFCLALMTLATLASAQMFADLNLGKDGRRRSSRLHHDDEERRSAVEQLDGNSSIWDLLAAHQKDFMNLGGFQRLYD